jgi:hypothetical protein
MLNGKIKILDSDIVIQRKILDSLKSGLKLIFNKARSKIESEVRNIIVEAISNCPEINSLRSGKLRLDFGLDSDPTSEIIYAIANSTFISFRDFKLQTSGTSVALNIYVQPTDFQNLLLLPGSSVTTEAGASLPWLQWLLTAGDAIIVTGYRVEYSGSPASRSGGAIMVPKGVFKVDSSFSGTADDNFISRAINKYQDRIKESVEKNL